MVAIQTKAETPDASKKLGYAYSHKILFFLLIYSQMITKDPLKLLKKINFHTESTHNDTLLRKVVYDRRLTPLTDE